MSTKVAAVHSASVFLDKRATLDKAVGIIEEASRNGAKIIAFPETYLPGYPFWIWTHTPTTGAPLFQRLFDNSVEVPGPETAVLAQAAAKAGAWVVMGVDEKAGGTLYNTMLYFSPEGELVARHRKLQPTHAERTIWGRGDGSDVFVVPTEHGVLGGLICWEHTMDLNRYALTAMGQQIHVGVWPAISALTHNPHSGIFDDVTEAASRHHALSAQSFVIVAQSRIDADTIEQLGLTGQDDMIREGGGWSAVIGPEGQFRAGPHRDTEAIVYADIDLDDITLVKYACDSSGHYARPDVFQLQVNRTAQNISSGLANTDEMVIIETLE